MSATLMWEPVKREAKSLPDDLKFVLRDKCGIDAKRSRWNKDHIPYLAGLKDAGIEEAQELIDILEKHGEIELWLEY